MTTNKPEVVSVYRTGTGETDEMVRLSDYEALQAEREKLRTCLAETVGVAVTMLYESHRQDTIKEFAVTELSRMVDSTKHLADADVQVEKVYRKAWDMAQGSAVADGGGVQ